MRMGKKKDWHAQGEKDGSVNKYNPPIDALQPLFGSVTKDDLQHQDEYKAGWKNAKKHR